MDDLKLKCTSVSRGNVVRFDVVAGDRDSQELKNSGMPGFGSAEFVLPNEDHEFEAGSIYTFSLIEETA